MSSHESTACIDASSGLFSVFVELNGIDSAGAAVDHVLLNTAEAFEDAVAVLWELDPDSGTATPAGTSPGVSASTVSPSESTAEFFDGTGHESTASNTTGLIRTDGPSEPYDAELSVPVGETRLLTVRSERADAIDETDRDTLRSVAMALEVALDRMEGSTDTGAEPGSRSETGASAALRRLHELTVAPDDIDETVDQLLLLGCEHFGLQRAMLSSTDGTDYEIEAAVGATEADVGTVLDLEETMCGVTVDRGTTDPLAFADVAETEFRNHPAAERVGAYIAAPVVVRGDIYGTVKFADPAPRAEAFREDEAEFVKLVAQWVGNEIGRRRRIEKLERYRTILEAIDDPVYTLDTDGRFTYVNEAAERQFGYGEEVIGEHVSVGMDEADIEQMQGQIEKLVGTDERSTTAEFELQTENGEPRIVENRLALIGDDEFRGTAGVLRDITARQERERELELKERAMDEATVGIQITDPTQEGNPLVYVNDGFERMTGYTSEDATGRNPRFLQGEDSDPEQVARLREAIDSEEPISLELKNHRKDGTPYWSRISVTPVTDEDGTVTNYIGIQQDVTERREREQKSGARVDLLERIYEVTTDPQTGFEEKIDGLLEAGRDYLDLPYGFLTQTDMDGSPTARTQTIVEAVGSHELLQPGESGALSESYCQRTVGQDDVLALTNAAESELVDDTAYGTFGLETYIGGKVNVGDDVYGTLCFASSEPQEHSFDEFERSLVSLLGQWAGYEIERRGTREKLEDSQQRYQTLLEAAPDPVFVADAETGDIVEVNAAAEELRGQSRETLIGLDQAELHPEGDHDLYREAFEQSVGHSTLVSELPDGTQPKLCGSDGEPVPVEINATSAQLPDGPVICGVFRDISKRRERERELELKERAMDEANVGITISDPDREDNPLVYVNDGFVDQTGYTRADALGRNCRFLQADDREQPALDTLRDAIETEEPVTVQLRNYRKDGEQFWNRLSVTPVYDEDGTLADYIGIQQDVTEKVTSEQRMRALHGTTRELLGADDEGEAVEKALDTLADELDFLLAGVYLREGDELVRAGAVGPHPGAAPDRVERGRTPLWKALDAGEPVVIEDYEALGDDIERGDMSKGAYVSVGDRGVVVVGTADSSRLDESEQRLVEVLAGNLASVLDTLARERELFEEREQFRLLTESVDEYAFLTVDEDASLQTWNAGAENLFGYNADTALGMSMAELHPESKRESGLPERLLQQARIGGESAHEGWRIRADGSEFYADVRYAPLESNDGEFRGYAMVVRDMTDRRRQQRRTKRFVEESTDVVTIVDPDGTITYASGSAERVLDYDPEDIVGENLFDYLHPDGREHALQTFYECVDGADSVKAECRLASPDGGWFNIEGRCRNMLDDDAVNGILIYLRDVTESKERARRFESIFNQTFQFTGLLEPDGTVVEVNDAALEFGGFERNEIVGNRFFDAQWWTHSETVRANARDAIERAANGEFVRYETEVRGGDGLATIDFSVKPVRDDDDDVTLLVVEGRDITAQQQHRRHLEVMQRVMRHNMRNDLTKMRGWTQVMSEEENPEERAEQFGTVERILDKWEAMTEKMGEIRQILQSQDEEWTTTEASSLIEDAVRPVHEEYDDATVLTEVPSSEAIQVPAPLLEAVRELVDNAADASEDATVEVELTCPEDDWINVTVRDDGPGLPEMEVDVLETGEETPLNHGQGLGLWMVRTVVTQAGGDVSVESTTDGTEVRLRLPRASPAGPEVTVETGE